MLPDFPVLQGSSQCSHPAPAYAPWGELRMEEKTQQQVCALVLDSEDAYLKINEPRLASSDTEKGTKSMNFR